MIRACNKTKIMVFEGEGPVSLRISTDAQILEAG